MPTELPIVVTGFGLACCLGVTSEATFDAVIAGCSGLGSMGALEQTPVPDKGGGQAVELPESEDGGTPREVRYLRHVIRHALGVAGPHPYAPSRVAAVMGTTLHGMRAAGRWFRGGDISELRSFPAGAVLREALRDSGAEGTRLSTCSACSSGLGAVAMGVTLLRSGEADLVIAGGYDTVSEYVYAGFDSLRLVAEGPPRPFGASRDGMKTAEGYGVVILEREGDAAARGARVRGYVAGCGESADAHHLTHPHPEGVGAHAAIVSALGKAGLAPEQVGLIAAHATATVGNDAAEYAALSKAFGDGLQHIPVVAFKSHLGHTLGGAGAVELVLALLARERGVVPSTRHALPQDPAFTRLRLNHGAAAPAAIGATLNLSLGFGGANTCVVMTSSRPLLSAVDAQEAVITGVGVVLPDAVGNERFVELLSGQPRSEACRGGHVPEAAIAHLLNTRRVRRMSDYVKLTLAATSVACEHAGIDDLPAFAGDACVVLGTMHGSANFCEAYYSQIVREGLAGANPVLFAEGVPNSGAAQLSLMLGVRGGCQTIIGSRTAGLDALRLAALRIREGSCSRAFVGAGEEYCETVNRASIACGLPESTSFSSGALVLVVESRRSAMARGGRVLAAVESGWSVAGSAAEVARAVRGDEGRHAFLATSLGEGRTDRVVKHGLGGVHPTPHWSVLEILPECFSVGGLAALAGVLLAPGALPGMPVGPGESVLVMGTDFVAGATGIRLRL